MSFSSSHILLGRLLVHKKLKDTIDNVVAPGTGINKRIIWDTLEKILIEFSSENEALLRKRETFFKLLLTPSIFPTMENLTIRPNMLLFLEKSDT